MGTFDLHAEDGAIFQLHVEVAVEGDWLIGLGGLVVLGQVRIEVVFTRKPAIFGDLAVQRQAEADGVFHGLLVDHRQGAGQSKADLIDVGVRVIAERVGRGGKHLGFGVQLHVHLETQHGVVGGDSVFESNDSFAH